VCPVSGTEGSNPSPSADYKFQSYAGNRKTPYLIRDYFRNYRSPIYGFTEIEPPFGELSRGHQNRKEQFQVLLSFGNLYRSQHNFNLALKSDFCIPLKALI
jgi:hypothetical protein